MRLVDEEVIDAELVEDQAVVFFLLGEQVFEALLAPGFLLLQVFDDVAVRAGGVRRGAVTQELVIGGDLLAQKRSRKARDMPMRSKELWVVMMPSHRRWRSSRSGACAARGWKSSLAAISRLRVGVELHALPRELRQHVIGDDIEGLVISPACFIFMPAATMTLVFPAPTAWARRVLPLLMMRQTASF